MKKLYSVTLTAEEVQLLENIIHRGKHSALKRKRAQALLKAHQGQTDAKIAEAIGITTATVANLRKRFAKEGLKATLAGKPRTPRNCALDARAEAHLVKLVCSTPPEGFKRWTLRLLRRHLMVKLKLKTLSIATVRKVLKKHKLKPWQHEEFCIPPEQDAEFIKRMEDLLDLYKRFMKLCQHLSTKRRPNPKYPLVCMDESPRQLVGDVIASLPMEPGQPERFDTFYKRKGNCNLFLFIAPFLGWRRIDVTSRRTGVDWAHQIKRLVDEDFPKAKKIILVMDNLNTHFFSSLCKAFDLEEAKRIM